MFSDQINALGASTFLTTVNRTLHRLHKLVFVVMLISGFALKSQAALSEKEIATIEQLLVSLSSLDLREASGAAEALKNHPYSEVAKALLRTLRSQIETESFNSARTYVIGGCVKSLSAIGTVHESKEVVEILGKVSANKSKFDKFGDKIERSIQDLLQSITVRETALPKYSIMPAASQTPSHNQNKSLAGLMNDLELDSEIRLHFRKNLFSAVETNFYDEGLARLEHSKNTVLTGRDMELERIIQASLRSEKSHILITGKAGVGKTTLVRMLQEGWLRGTIPYPGKSVPIVLELSILDITNEKDPTAIKNRIAVAQELASKLGRHVFLFVDEAHVSTSLTRNALKSFLTKEMNDANMIHMIWATTSSESRDFLSDSAFSRRWLEVFVREFNNSEAIAAIKSSYLYKWKQRHNAGTVAFSGISDDAFEFAAKYGRYEQPHAGNPTAIKEILEGTIVYKLRELQKKMAAGEFLSENERSFTLQPQDIRSYIQFQKGIDFLPGDKDFTEKFEKRWAMVREAYVGNEAFALSQKELLRNHFSNLEPRQMNARIYFGPPGVGKSYFPEVASEVFFHNKPLVVNMAEYSQGGLAINKLIGSPTGTSGSEEQRSVLTSYIKENPQGGFFVFEEADLAHPDVFNLLVNMLSSKKFTDGLGKEWDVSRFITIFTSNVGQDLMVSRDAQGGKLTWQDIDMRRQALLQKVLVDGKETEVVRADKLDKLMDQFIQKIGSNTAPYAETSNANQDGLKLKRRIKPDYVFLPTQQELIRAAEANVKKYIDNVKKEYQVTFEISKEDIEKILDLKSYRFEDGFSYVGSQLESRLYKYTNDLLYKKGSQIKLTLINEEVAIGKKMINGLALVVESDGKKTRNSLGISVSSSDNPWFSNAEMREKIAKFPLLIAGKIMDKPRQVEWLHSSLKRKLMNWNERIVWTDLGTSGNGKTELGFTLADALYGSRKAAFKISGIQRWGDLNNYFRSDVGFIGSNQETDFEKWMKSRLSLGGGVIIFDELLSFDGLSKNELAEKINAINKLYDILDEGFMKIGNKMYDIRGFQIQITGNSLQEFFSGIDDTPEAEKLVAKVLAKIDKKEIIQYFSEVGIDAPKVARFGEIFVNGPLSKATAAAVSMKELKKAVNEATMQIRDLYDVNVIIDPVIAAEIANRVTTVKLGMREVNTAAKKVIGGPIAGILFDQMGVEKIEARLVNGQILWLADGKEVVRVKESVGTTELYSWKYKSDVNGNVSIATPGFADIVSQPKIILTQDELYRVAVHELTGHWMMDYLLNGRNGAAAISIIPSEKNLGYMRPKESLDHFEDSRLTSWLKELMVLEAGHRAVFLSGFYSGGGGSDGRRSREERARDDLGRVEETFDVILSNQIFERLSEFDSPEEKALAKKFLRSVVKGAADRVIRYGKGTKLFEGLLSDLLKERFLSEEKIEAALKKGSFEKLLKPDQLLVRSINYSVLQTLQRMQKELHPVKFLSVAELARELMQKTVREVKTTNALRGQVADRGMDDNLDLAIKRIKELTGRAEPSKSIAAPLCRGFFR